MKVTEILNFKFFIIFLHFYYFALFFFPFMQLVLKIVNYITRLQDRGHEDTDSHDSSCKPSTVVICDCY